MFNVQLNCGKVTKLHLKIDQFPLPIQLKEAASDRRRLRR